MRYWLMKTEPAGYSIYDLEAEPDQTTHWDGVRNYQARNLMREMQIGDRVLFYHSVTNPGVAGTAEVVREAYPDHTQFDPTGKYFDPKADPAKPRWWMVDVRLLRIFPRQVPLKELRMVPELAEMGLLKRGNRLSVQPVTEQEFRLIEELADQFAP